MDILGKLDLPGDGKTVIPLVFLYRPFQGGTENPITGSVIVTGGTQSVLHQHHQGAAIPGYQFFQLPFHPPEDRSLDADHGSHRAQIIDPFNIRLKTCP